MPPAARRLGIEAQPDGQVDPLRIFLLDQVDLPLRFPGNASPRSMVRMETWMLKQVQHDEERGQVTC
jgi:hypothetical protein